MKLGILGAGSWGLTLARLWATSGPDGSTQTLPEVWVWDRNPEKIAQFQANRDITFPLPMTLPPSLILTSDMASMLSGTDIIVLAVTAEGTRAVCRQLFEYGVSREAVIINTSKGIEQGTFKRLSQVIQEELPWNPQAVMSGPTLAPELLRGLPTAASLACEDFDLAEQLQTTLSRNCQFRLYSNPDVTGVELGGALKNIFAIASGYITERKLGDNARAALITRGLSEMTQFAVRLGAQEMTLYGLSGLGDLMATCHSPLSRNFQVGAMLAQGMTLPEIMERLKVVAEGVQTTHVVSMLAEKLGVAMPIVSEINRALSEPLVEDSIIRSLMSRKLTSETPRSWSSGGLR